MREGMAFSPAAHDPRPAEPGPKARRATAGAQFKLRPGEDRTGPPVEGVEDGA